jgi:putative transposase
VPAVTILDLSQAEQAALLAALRRSRYGYLLALHVLLLCAAGKTPTEISDYLFCSRSSVYRIVAAYRAGTLGFGLEADGRLGPPIRTTVLLPWLRRALLALLKRSPRTFGWCRTRWSCALLAAELAARRGVVVSAETVRRWVHEVGWVWKRAKLSGRDDDPERNVKLARIRYAFENLGRRAVMVFADELDIALLAKVGFEWMPKGEQTEIPTPGSNQKNYLAGALELRTGRMTRCVWWRKQAGLFLDLLKLLDEVYRVGPYARIYVVVDNAKIHKARVVLRWLAEHRRFVLLYLPTYCPRANPIERAFGDVHDNCTRNHKRKRLRDLVSDVEEHFEVNGPWKYKLPSIYYEPEVTAALAKIAAHEELLAA